GLTALSDTPAVSGITRLHPRAAVSGCQWSNRLRAAPSSMLPGSPTISGACSAGAGEYKYLSSLSPTANRASCAPRTTAMSARDTSRILSLDARANLTGELFDIFRFFECRDREHVPVFLDQIILQLLRQFDELRSVLERLLILGLEDLFLL